MSVRLISDHAVRLAAQGLRYDPSKHHLREGSWIRSARRMSGRKDLLLYKHVRSGLFMVGVWVQKPNSLGLGGVILELEEMYGDPDIEPSKALSFSMLRIRLRPCLDLDKRIEHQQKMEWERECYVEDQTRRQAQDLAGWLDHKGPKYAHLAHLLRNDRIAHYVGDDEGGEQLKNVREAFLSMK